ncbi:hypothetical protein CP556_20475 [Natrinema sp. CBA1119]|nr:hypothetical protein CP556_20475 [Natrinema sp. CBA1119]
MIRESNTLIRKRRRITTVSTETPEPTETEAFERVYETLVDRILAGEIEHNEVEKAKLKAWLGYSTSKVPKKSELLDYTPEEHRETLGTAL